MHVKDFYFIQVTPEESRQYRPDLPLLLNIEFDQQKFKLFSKQVKESIAGIDFSELQFLVDQRFSASQIPIYLTYGIEPLYDAWTTSNKNEIKIFLNADGFNFKFEVEDTSIIVHELVHFLIANRLPTVDDDDYLGQYHRMMIDEGLAHFLSFPYREKILDFSTHYADKKSTAENQFYASQKLLISNISDLEKQNILIAGNTGPYWSKHASIFGLFHFAELFKINGITACLDRLNSFSNFPNLNCFFSDDLHDYPENPTHLKKYLKIEEHEIQKIDGDEKYKKLSHLAVHYRQLRDFKKAHELFEVASDFFENKNPKMTMINNLRWADVYRFEKKFDEAWDLLKKVEETLFSKSYLEYQDFYLQHLGKFYFDKSEFKKAIECFEGALAIRLTKGNPELIRSTEFALKVSKLNLANKS